MRLGELTKSVLGALILAPNLLEATDLGNSDFIGRDREVFEIITQLWEDGRPAEIDPVLLAKRLGGNGSAVYVSELLDGRARTAPEIFAGRVRALRLDRLAGRISRGLQKELEQYQKTQTPPDLAGLKAAFEELRALENPKPREPLLGNLADVQPEPVTWLWEPYFPASKLIAIGGDPDSGKSWFALSLAARLSRGLPWPDGSPNNCIGSTVYLSGEDEAGDTLRPRIDSLGGDPGKIRFLARDSLLDLTSPELLQELENEISEVKDCRLLVLDPAFDFTGGINPNATEQSRAFLGVLKPLSKRLSMATLLILHTRKNEVQRAIDYLGGSKSGWAGKVRAAFGIEPSKEDETRRILFKIKSNLAPVNPPKLAFRITQGRLEFEARPADVTTLELLKHEPSEDGPQIREAKDFLRTILASGPLLPCDVYDQAREAGIARRTLDRAKPKAGVDSFKDGPRWKWFLKDGNLHSQVGNLPSEKALSAGRQV